MNDKKMILIFSIILLLSVGSVLIFAAGQTEDESMETPAAMMIDAQTEMMPGLEGFETAIFAGGCFWGVEGVFEMLEGVANVESGYSGGDADTAHYKMVGTGTTGHAEAVRIIYDPASISYEKLLEIFFTVAHDPTQLNYQGPDTGTEYRSAVFYMNDQQKDTVENFIKALEKKKLFKKKIVTQIQPLDAFYPAEDYHQNFMVLNPTHPYIVYWDKPKVMDLESKYPELIKK